jgi:hypothetical protein
MIQVPTVAYGTFVCIGLSHFGGIAAGVGYALTGGNTRVVSAIWRSSLGGDFTSLPRAC